MNASDVRAKMPSCAAFSDHMAEAFGRDAFKVKYASEAGAEIGKRDDTAPTRINAEQLAQLTAGAKQLRDPEYIRQARATMLRTLGRR